jgi:outer membrane protein assembly factor BamB
MKTPTNKVLALLIAGFFMLSIIAVIPIPKADAHTPAWNIPTYAYANASPNPAGLGQTVTIGFWLDIPPLTANAQYGDRWTGFKVTITGPSGATTSLGPFTSDATGGTYTLYTPTEEGTYTVFFSFPGQTLAGNNMAPGSSDIPYVGDYFLPSNATTTFTVQQTAVPGLSQNPLPTEYWTRPIQSINYQWSTISGSWLGFSSSGGNSGGYNVTGNYNPYTLAPTTAHLLWTKSAGAPGGLIGGEFGGTSDSNFNAPQQYQPKFAPIIMNGVLYYEMIPGSSNNPTGWAAVDLKTGETLWIKNQTTGVTNGAILRCGQLLDFHTPNQYGAHAYLWATGNPFGISTLTGVMCSVPASKQTAYNTGAYLPASTSLAGTTYSIYDAVSGNYVYSIVNATYSMTLTEDEGGNIIGYFVNSTNPKQPLLGMWNSTLAVMNNEIGAVSNSWIWRPAQNLIVPWADGVQWTAPVATNLNGAAFPTQVSTFNGATVNGALGIASSCIEDNTILMTCAGSVGGFQTGFQIEAGYSTIDGSQRWITNRTQTEMTRIGTLAATHGVYGQVNLETGVVNGFYMATGKQAWGPITLPDQNPYSSIGGYQSVSANGVNYLWGFGGTIYALNMETGEIIWTTNTTKLLGPSGSDTPYGVWPLWTSPPTVGSAAGGLVFIGVGHSYSPPMFNGAQLLAINCTDGTLVWSHLAFDVTCGTAVSDGVAIAFSSYDNSIYAYGMGPTKTTVTAPNIGVTTATPITIRGTVTDISSGASQNAVAANYPNGLPCISDASMSDFMEAVYQQQPMPSNISGVPVTISVLDSNGNYRVIGSATSNALGDYAYTWTPDIAGDYTVYATFTGSGSYYSSQASTAIYAQQAAATQAPQATQSPSAADLYFIPATAGLFIAIIVIGSLTLLMLRKKP